MNAPAELKDQKALGLYQKYIVTRTDGDPTGKHSDDEYFVLDLTTDKHAITAISAYAESCADEYPRLANDLRAKIAATVTAANEFIQVPSIALPNGAVVPAFKIGKFLSSCGPAGMIQINAENAPWVNVNYHEAMEACGAAGYNLLTELKALAIAYDISQQDINWTGGKVGEGSIYQGIHKGNVSSAQPGSYESTDPEERRWHQLSNGERIYDFAGNAFSWIFDDVQGDESGLSIKITADSLSLTVAPFPSEEKGMGWRPDGARDWSGRALVRGGCWNSGSDAGVFYLYGDWPGYRRDYVGFRCTL